MNGEVAAALRALVGKGEFGSPADLRLQVMVHLDLAGRLLLELDRDLPAPQLAGHVERAAAALGQVAAVSAALARVEAATSSPAIIPPVDESMTAGDWLAKLRGACRLTYEELAAAAGVPVASIKSFETENRNRTGWFVRRLAIGLAAGEPTGVDPDQVERELLGLIRAELRPDGEWDSKKAAAAANRATPGDQIRLRRLRRLSAEAICG